MTPIIELKNVWYSIHNHIILKDINLSIHPLDFLAIIGPNGGGKTTLIKLMLGLFIPEKGQISLFNELPSKNIHRVGYVPQEIGINKSFPISVLDIVLMGRLNRKKRKWPSIDRSDKEAAEKALKKMNMWNLRDRRIGNLSGGQRQRVYIARALAGEPEIILFDEPTASIDTKGQTEFFQILKDMNKHTTIVLVSHDIMVLSSYVKTVACVNQTLFYHHEPELTQEMCNQFHCPSEFLFHVPNYRFLQEH